MTDSVEQARLREHLSELGHAAKAIGKDVSLDVRDLDVKIGRLGKLTGKEAKYALYDIEDGMAHLGHQIDREAKRLPGQMADQFSRFGNAVGDGLARIGDASRDAFDSASHRTREGTRNALASAAGVKRTPMKQWTHPASEAKGREPD
jgi:hypothetical protein